MGWSHNKKNRRQMDEKNSRVDFKRMQTSLGRPPARWADVFVNKVNQLYPQLQLFYRSRYETRKRYNARTRPPPLITIVIERNEWHMCWVRTAREDGPSKYPSIQASYIFSICLFENDDVLECVLVSSIITIIADSGYQLPLNI
ncbi:unnamed protein product [Angiostrongylus costaricensis]|uniref:Transposase n=1 Tax=Angiostrongylus costaricensis TaxID=334426 RepID=A0A0R3PKN8_ANGCS|nr:unnamed protein product [Angiostrongylus costaricensis]